MAAEREGPAVLLALEAAAEGDLAAQALVDAGYATSVCANGEELLRLARAVDPRLVVLGVCLPGVSGYECCYELRAEFGPALAILLASSTRTERLDATVGLLLGADDVIVGPLNEGELLARVTRLVSARTRSNGSQQPELTNRESEVLALLAEGLQQKEIAHELGISPKTVATYLERIRRKLGARNRTEAISKAHRSGLLALAVRRDARRTTT